MVKKISVFMIMLGLMIGGALALALKDDISISLEQKRIKDLSPAGATLVFYVNINNSSSKTYNLSANSLGKRLENLSPGKNFDFSPSENHL